MEEWGIDISQHSSDAINDYLNEGIHIVITVCDNANQICPVFPGDVQRIHWSIDDPFRGWSSELLDNFRETRQELKERLGKFISDK
jgi:arsenate reductase